MWFALFAVVVVRALGYFDVQISAKILGIALLGELLIIAIFTFGVLFQGGADGVSIEPILPWNFGQGVAPGIGVFFAFWSWVGFEAAPNYAEESKDPQRTIPIAVYFSCVGVGVLYTLMMWAVVTAYGDKGADGRRVRRRRCDGTGHAERLHVRAAASRTSCTWPMEAYVGHFASAAMDWLIVTGALACGAALLNAGIRYWYALGREGILPRALGRTHPKHKTPHVAILTVGRSTRADPGVLVPQPAAARDVRLAGGAGRDLDRARAGADGAVDVLLLPARASDGAALVEDERGPVDRLRRPGLRPAAAVLEPVLPRRRRVVREPGVRDPVDRRA